MKYALPDGKVVSARSYTDVVIAMNEEKFTPARNLSRYRTALVERVKMLYGSNLDSSSDKALVEGLVSVGLLVRIPQ